MPKNISWRNLIQNFRKLGFDGPYSGGRHLFMKKCSLKVHIPSKHKGGVSAALMNEILRQAGINKEEWNRL